MGLINKEVEVVLNSANMKYYENLGYKIPRQKDRNGTMRVSRGTKITVKVEDLSKGGHELIEVECDICGEKELINYKYYLNKINKNVLHKCVCKKCSKTKEVKKMYAEQNFKNGSLNKEDKGYYSIKENRLKELQKWINEYGNINLQTNKEGTALYANILKYNETPYELAIELGYDIYDVMNKKPMGWYKNFSVVENKINQFIKDNGYFPTTQETGLSTHTIKKYGGIYEIKRKMKYDDKKDLKDNSGFYNKSRYELWTANYLLANNINYKREGKPFKGKKYRTDFELLILNDKNKDRRIFVEVWGYDLDNITQKSAIEYNEKRKVKEKLYKEYGYELISINANVFKRKTFDEIQNNLYNIFSPYLDLKYKAIDNNIVFPVEMTDDELFSRVMTYSKNGRSFPRVRELSKEDYKLYIEVIKRYNNFKNFAHKFGALTISEYKSKIKSHAIQEVS